MTTPDDRIVREALATMVAETPSTIPFDELRDGASWDRPSHRKKATPMVALVVFVAVILGGVATAVLTQTGRGGAPLAPSQGWVVAAFLADEVSTSPSEVAAVVAELESQPGVVDLLFVDKAASHAEALEMFADQPEVIRVLEDNPDIVPASIRVLTGGEEDAGDIAAFADQLPGVEHTDAYYGTIHELPPPDADVTPAADGSAFADPEHVNLRFTQDLTLTCQGHETIDNGGFDSFTMDIWIDNQAGFTRLGIDYPDGSTYDLIFKGRPGAWEQAWGNGTDLGRNAGCRETRNDGGYSQSVVGWAFQDLSDLWFTAYLTPVSADTNGVVVNVEGSPTHATTAGPSTYLVDEEFADGTKTRREFTLDEAGIRVIEEHRYVHVPDQFEATATIEVMESGPAPMPPDIFDTSTFTPLWSDNPVVTTTQATNP